MAKIKAPSVGEFIAAQRRSAELSLRQLAELTGVSNPYLSQIERGLRKPSAEVLQQLSKALRVSAETLYVRAGILDPTDHPNTSVEMAILADPSITERQKSVLIEVYASFVEQNTAEGGAEDSTASAVPSKSSTTKAGTTRPRAARSGTAKASATKSSSRKSGTKQSGPKKTTQKN